MIRSIAVAFALALAASVQAMPLVPLQPMDDLVISVREGCGPGRIAGPGGTCVARTTVRQTRRVVRRCLRWEAGVCARYAD